MTIKAICCFFTKNKYPFILVLLIAFLLVIQSIFYPLLQGHDFKYHYNRFYTLYESIVEGTFPNYMDYYLINGYGYLVKNFYSDFLLIPFAVLSQLIGVKQSYNFLLLSSSIFCSLSCYFSFKNVVKDKFGAIIFTLLYTTSCYRFTCLYERSALGEVLAISCIPLVFWGLYEIINGDYKKIYILSIGASLMIYAHAITSLLVFLVCAIYFILNIKQIIASPIRVKYLGYSVFLCVLLSLYHLLPYFEMLSFDDYQFNSRENDFSTQKIETLIYGALKLFDNKYNFYNPRIGLLIFIPALLLRPFVSRKNTIIKKTDVFLVGGVLLLFAASDYFPWSIFPFKYFAIIQFSYRLFSIATFLFVFCTAIYCSILLKKRIQKLTAFSLFLMLIIISLLLESSRYKTQTEFFSPGEISVTTVKEGISGAEFLPADFILDTERKALVIEHNNLHTRIENISKNKDCLIFNLKVTEPDTLILPFTYYKGYKVTINNQEIEYFSTNGLISISPSVSGMIETQYIGTYIIKLSLIISLTTYLILGLFILRNYRKNRKKYTKL